MKIFRGESPTAAQKTVQIVTKGLHVLARKRYQSIEQLRLEMEELLLRIDGKGISHSALWEGSRKSMCRQKRMEEPYLARSIQKESGEIISEECCQKILAEGGKILLSGPGGMGKTRFLLKLWNREMQSYRPYAPVTVYIPLADYQETGGGNSYIRKYLLRHLCFWEQAEDMENAMHELERFLLSFPEENNTPAILLLLDGLNEAGSRISGLVKEMEELGSRFGLGILVTDRTNSVKQYGLKEFQSARLLPFSKQEVMQELSDAHMECPDSQELLELLCNPMMLALYRSARAMDRENGQGQEGLTAIQSADDMILCYLDRLRIQKQRLDSGDQAEQLRSNYLLCHLLPEIAAELKRQKKTLLTVAELSKLTDKSYRKLQQKDFTLAFPEYLGKSRLMFQGIANGMEWFDYAVCEQLLERWNLLEVSSDGNYRLIHDNFIAPLSKRNAENRKKQNRGKRKRLKVAGGMVLLAVFVLLISGLSCRSRRKQAEQAIHTANQRVLRCVEDLNVQILKQKEILESVMEEQVFEENTYAAEEIRLRIKERMEFVDRNRSGSSFDREEYIRKLEMARADIPIEAVESLYDRPEEMAEMRKEAMANLEEKLCEPDSPYFDKEKRGELVDTYEAWLDAYEEVVCLELYEILVRLDKKEQKEMLEALGEVGLFREYTLEHPLSDKTEESIYKLLKSAKKELEGLSGAEMDMVKQQLLDL